MPHGVDAAVHAVQASSNCACPDRFFAETEAPQLVYRDRAVPVLREFRIGLVGCGEFPGHYKG